MQRRKVNGARLLLWTCSVLSLIVPIVFSGIGAAQAEQPKHPCHPNPDAASDRATVAKRGDVVNVPKPLKDLLIRIADRPHTYLPMQAFAEAHFKDGAPKPSRLFQYYLLDT